MKVILAGFSKCGTKTMESAFKELGYNNYDFLENYRILGDDWIKIFKAGGSTEDFHRMFKGVDSVTDLPCCFFWEEICKAYPEAKIVLTQRDNEDIWYDSFMRQLTSGDKLVYRILEILSPTNYGMKLFLQKMFVCVCGYNFNLPWFGSHTSNELLLKMTYRKHNTYVMEKAPKDQLLLFNLKDGWKPLCEFLNEPIPDKPFPHKNKNASIGDEMMAVNPLFIRMQREMMLSLSLIGIASSYCAYKLVMCNKSHLFSSIMGLVDKLNFKLSSNV